MPPDRRQVVRVIKGLQALMFPMCFRREDPEMEDEQLRQSTMALLYTELCAAMRFREETAEDAGTKARSACDAFIARLPGIRETLLKAQGVYDRNEVMWNTACYGYFLRMYAVLGQHYLLNPRIRTHEMVHSVDSEVITAAMGYINSHFREELSLDDVAEFAGFSR
jgi:hypothetical protein